MGIDPDTKTLFFWFRRTILFMTVSLVTVLRLVFFLKRNQQLNFLSPDIHNDTINWVVA
jgi:hypothetical protein